MSYKIKATKSGYNVLTESNVNNYIFNSDYNTFKIVKSGTGSVTVTADNQETKTITHNYGTRVGFIVFFKYPNGRVTFMSNVVATGSGDVSIYVQALPQVYNTANSISFGVINFTDSNQTIYYTYYLFEIPA